MTIPIYFLLLPGYVLMEFACAADALRLANRAGARFDIHVVSPDPAPLHSLGMATAGVDPLPPTLPPGSWIIVPGIAEVDRNLRGHAASLAVRWLRAVVQPDVRLVTICAGALVAAQAGLLEGVRCTTHHTLVERLREVAPTARVEQNRIFVIDGGIASSAGVTTGVDLMLELIGQAAGVRLALDVAREMVVWMRRDAASPQHSPFLAHRNHMHPAIHRVQDAIAADPSCDWPLDELARIAHVGPRHLARLFRENVGISAVDYRQQMQLALAEPLMRQTSWPLEKIAEASGFGSPRDLRRVWQKHRSDWAQIRHASPEADAFTVRSNFGKH